MSARVTPDRAVGVAALAVAVIAPLLFSSYWVSALLTQMLLLGIVAASLIFLSAYGGLVSLAQVAIFGIAGFVLGNATTTGDAVGPRRATHAGLPNSPSGRTASTNATSTKVKMIE